MYEVAVSLGTGSVLLLGDLLARDDCATQEHCCNGDDDDDDLGIRCKGLLQLRLLLVDEGPHEEHEISLFVAPEGSKAPCPYSPDAISFLLLFVFPLSADAFHYSFEACRPVSTFLQSLKKRK